MYSLQMLIVIHFITSKLVSIDEILTFTHHLYEAFECVLCTLDVWMFVTN